MGKEQHGGGWGRRAPRPVEMPPRKESVHKRFDRNFAELLQELRVTLTGVQILFAFLLILPFQSRFAEVGSLARMLYTLSLTSVVLAAVVLTAPVAFHRLIFRRNVKHAVVSFTHGMVIAGLALLSVGVVSSMWLALRVAGLGTASLIPGVVGVVLVLLWWLVPFWIRVLCAPQEEEGEVEDEDPALRG